jgi:hypothetical protein
MEPFEYVVFYPPLDWVSLVLVNRLVHPCCFSSGMSKEVDHGDEGRKSRMIWHVVCTRSSMMEWSEYEEGKACHSMPKREEVGMVQHEGMNVSSSRMDGGDDV